jgi:DNA-binding NarL/FixJ family response regulator
MRAGNESHSKEARMATEPESGKTRIFIVDDHPLVREWLANLINQQSDLKVCGEAANASEALKLIPTAKPHIAILNISKAAGSGIELIRNIRATSPKIAVVVLSIHDERSLRAGARGYVTKRAATKNVLQAIRCVLGGRLYLVQEVARLLAKKLVDGETFEPFAPGFPVDLISSRELEVFKLLGSGYSTIQIAGELRVSVKTIQSFCSRIKEKLKLSSFRELSREAVLWHDRQKLK